MRKLNTFTLFSLLNNETITNTLADNSICNHVGMFCEWAINNNVYLGQQSQASIVASVKNNTANGVDFICAHSACGQIYAEDFAPNYYQFIRQYCHNISGNDVVYQRDYAMCFLVNNSERKNYLGDAAVASLSKVTYLDDNKQKLFNVLDKRLAEFNSHGFAKSVAILKP